MIPDPTPDASSDHVLWAAKARKRPQRHGQKPASQFRGVTRTGRSWRASIHPGNRQVHLGCFSSERAAAEAWDAAAVKLWGTAAKLNFPTEAVP